jgi:DNA-binding transcriptional LysR family regulator
MQNLSDIAIFVKVVQHSSFTAAAEALDISQPVISKAVTRLEETLGARLLNRTTRRLSLTEAGAELYRRSAQALAEIENAELEVARYQTEPRGLLRVAAPMSFSLLHLTAMLPEFLDRYPGVQLDMQLDDRQVDLVADGFDLALRIGQLHDSTLIARRIAPCKQVVCTSPQYLASHSTPERPEDLLEHNCLAYTYLSTPREWRFKDSNGEVIVIPVKGSLQSNNGIVLRDAAVGGQGIAMLPTFYVCNELRDQKLKVILSEFPAAELSLYAVYPERRNLLPKVRAFIDFLIAKIQASPSWDALSNLDRD